MNKTITNPVLTAARSEAGHALASADSRSLWPADTITEVFVSKNNPELSEVRTGNDDVIKSVHEWLEQGLVLDDLRGLASDFSNRLFNRMIITAADASNRRRFDVRVPRVSQGFKYDDDRWTAMLNKGELGWDDYEQLILLGFFSTGDRDCLAAYRPYSGPWNYMKAVIAALEANPDLKQKHADFCAHAEQKADEYVWRNAKLLDELADELFQRATNGAEITTLAEVVKIIELHRYK